MSASFKASVFEQFRSQPEVIQSLRNALEKLCYSDKFCWCSLTLNNCTADWKFGNSGQPFSKASVQVKQNTYIESDRDGVKKDVLYDFGLPFQNYREALIAYLDDPMIEPTDKTTKLLFSKLLSYILDKDQHQLLLSKINTVITESEVAAVLAEHLFSKLTISSSYMLDDNHKYRGSGRTCPCGCGTDISNNYRDTSIGNSKVWYGNLDIVLAGGTAVIVEDEPDSSGETSPMEEIDKSDLESPAFKDQIIPRSIVFSFLQKKRHPELSSYLIPIIGSNRKNCVFYLYDSENDILLRSPCFSYLLQERQISVYTILAIWFAVNYRFLCTGIPADDVKKANFFKLASSVLPVYEKELSFGGILTSNVIVPYTPDLLSLSLTRITEPPKKKFKNAE